MQGQYNMRNPAVKRLMKEAQELSEPTEQYYAQPLEDNLFEWHFTIRGPADSEFDGGIYHGRIILPPEYPMKPPSIILLTPNGRFEIFKKICLSISGHHPESWQPSWSIRTALLAIIGFMPTHGNGAIGSLDYTPEERKVLARKSQEFKCTDCGTIRDKLKIVTEASKAETQEAKELAAQIDFQAENKANGKDKGDKKDSSETTTKDKTTATTMATTTTASTSNTSNSVHPQAPPNFPGFNPAMFGTGMPFPPGGFPMPFMFPPGMRPPSTSGSTGATNSSSPFAMPPGFMPPPFWPPMMPPGPVPGGNSSQIPPGTFPFPPHPFFTSPAAMLAAQQQAARNQQQANGHCATSTKSQTSQSSSTPHVIKSRATTTTVSSASAAPVSSSQLSAPSKKASASPEPVKAATTEVASTSRSTSSGASATGASPPTSTVASTTSATRSESTPEVRQRNVRQRAPTRPPQGQFQNATVPSDINVRQSEHPLVILLMVVLGIAILALLVRRVYMMNTWRFDTDF